MGIAGLQDVLVEELRDLLSAERQNLKALARLSKKVRDQELKQALEDHHRETEQQVSRLENCFGTLGIKARAKNCEGMKGILAEGEEVAGERVAAPLKDAMLLAAAQKVEHYEIGSYGTARTWAQVLGLTEVEKLLAETEEEEKRTDQRLSAIAQRLNGEASQVGQ